MTRPGPGTLSGDIPADHAALLRRIHELAADAARLRDTLQTTGADAAATAMSVGFEQVAAIDRQRALAEIQARDRGVHASWVEVVRRLGESGREWTDEHLLPTPLPGPGRRNTNRVVEDTRQLTDMAAITVAREHRLGIDGASGEPDHAAAQQLRRNMDALWTRADRTATSIGMGRKDRARVFDAATSGLAERVEGYLRYSIDDLDARWRTYITPALADGVRRSLKSLRRTDRGTTTDAPDAEQPPTPKALIEQARHALDTMSDAGAPIDAAIADAMPETTTDSWDTTTGVEAEETTVVDAYPDAGPDP